jgi:DNA-3-methyladenine glycosylase
MILGAETGGPPLGRPFPRELLAGDTLTAARALLGARLVRDPDPAGGGDAPGGRRVGRIVEVEAYIGENDRASHARVGRTRRNEVMFGPPGIAYVYLVYGMHHCLNVVTEPPPRAAAVLIRAVEPLAGIDTMRRARARAGRGRSPVTDARLAAGPGLVAAAFDIDRTFTGVDLCRASSALRLEASPTDEPAVDVIATPRIGIAYAGEPWASVPWRFVVAGHPSVSGPGTGRRDARPTADRA